jgi:hypothetical protein
LSNFYLYVARESHCKIDPVGWLVNGLWEVSYLAPQHSMALDAEWIRQLQTLCKATAAEYGENDGEPGFSETAKLQPKLAIEQTA